MPSPSSLRFRDVSSELLIEVLISPLADVRSLADRDEQVDLGMHRLGVGRGMDFAEGNGQCADRCRSSIALSCSRADRSCLS